jgi:basic amino acid/polyamine antiporter, APA family
MNRLARHLGLGMLVLYGIGDILGAGIYALVGKVAGEAGSAAWLSFLFSAILAAVTGLSYAELSSRVPRAAGAAAYCAEAFRGARSGSRAAADMDVGAWRLGAFPPFLVGLLVLASGITSAATVSMAIHGYLQSIFPLPQIPAALALIALMSFISIRGIRESSGVNALFTCVEAAGLLMVLFVGYAFVFEKDLSVLTNASWPTGEWLPVLSGATIAFYAFIGFEDLANLAEEAKNPSRDIPRAMVISVAVCTVVYMAVLFVVLTVMSPEEAAASERPLLEVLTRAGFGLPPWAFAVIALFAIVNTGLANLIMASRLLYGMASDGLLPRSLAHVHPGRKTPWVAVLFAMALCAVLVLSGGTKLMAQTTSLLLVIAFLFVHISLIRLRRRPAPAEPIFSVPGFVPWLGLVFCVLLSTQSPREAYGRAAIVAVAAFALYLFRPQARPDDDKQPA